MSNTFMSIEATVSEHHCETPETNLVLEANTEDTHKGIVRLVQDNKTIGYFELIKLMNALCAIDKSGIHAE